MSDDEEQNEEQKKAFLTLAIELGDKKKQLLNIYLDSKPEQLAYDFCLQNNLDFDSMQNLTEEIKNALQGYNPESSNQENRNQISEEGEQNTSNKKEEKEKEENNENLENKENESEHKTEELSEEHEHEHEEQEGENINVNDEKEQEQEKEEKKEEVNGEQELHLENEVKEVNQEKENKEIEQEQEKEEKDEKEEKEEKIVKEEEKEEEKQKEEINIEKEQEQEKSNKESSKKEEAEEDLLKEEERDKVLDQNNEKENPEEKENNSENSENEEDEDDDLPSYLSPTICFQNKQRSIVQPKPKSDFIDFDTRYKKLDKISEFNKDLNEKVVNHLTINLNNQKYLPKDYFDNPENKNFGERLYNREKIMKENAMEKARIKAKKENKKIEENMTFIPKINDYNLIALQNRKINKTQYNEEKRILNYKDYLKAKEENTKNKHYADIEKENTFAPKINKNSEKMAGNRSLQIPRYEQLFKKKFDFKKLEHKIYSNEKMFKPKINKNYKGIKSENNKMNEYANLTFEERQKRFKERMAENKEKLIEIKNANVDQRTGKKYFKPTINRNKKLEEERKNKKIFNELYRDSTKYRVKKEELVKKISELEKGLY